MKRIQEIAKLLNISEEIAFKVLEQMFLLGIDFSECSNKEFKNTAKEVFANINN